MKATEARELLAGLEVAGQPCRLEVESEQTADEGAAVEALRGRGWVCFTDHVETFEAAPQAESMLLAGEARVDEDTSVHVRHLGDAWIVTTYREREGDEHLAFDEAHGSSVPGAGDADRIRYRVYWRLQEEAGFDVWRPFAARFVGLDPEEVAR